MRVSIFMMKEVVALKYGYGSIMLPVYHYYNFLTSIGTFLYIL